MTLDEGSFEALFKSNFRSLCYLAIQYVKDADIAKDIVQDAFFSIWQKKEHIDLSKPVKYYLTAAVRNKSLNYIRDHKKFNDPVLESEEQFIKQDYRQPDRLIEEELRKRITLSIDELPEKCREVFLLSRYENLKYHEIAARLDISVKTVETQISKALQHMRIRLAEFMGILLIWAIPVFN
jgi:RNA polymerase sigma-70 factor (ECF subfamily)